MRILGAFTHALIDYAFALVLLGGPSFAGFAGPQATWCRLVGALHLVLTVVTRTPLGPVKVLSFRAHAAVEILEALFLLAMPWVGHFSAGVRSRGFFVGMGFLLALVFALTDYRDQRKAQPAA